MAVLLTALVAVSPLSTDMYLPAMPAIGQYFQVDSGDVQLTLSVFLLGFAVGQLIMGPMSDRFGRRPVLLAGLTIFFISTLACMLAPSITALMTARFFQAVGACAGTVISRAVVRDIYDIKPAARLLAHMSTAMAVGPLVAPLIGGYLTVSYGWPSNFAVLAAIGALVLMSTFVYLPESHTRPDLLALSIQRMALNYQALAKHVEFRDYVLSNAFAFAGLFAFISGSSFVLIDALGLGPQTFGYAFGVVVLGYMSGTQIAVRLLKKMSIENVVGFGGRIALIAGIGGLIINVLGVPSIIGVIAPMFCFALAVGIIMPNTMAGAVGPFAHMAGAAASVAGFVQMTVSAISGLLAGYLYDKTAVPMMAIIAACGLLSWLFTRRIQRNSPVHP